MGCRAAARRRTGLASLAQRISATAASTSWSRICAIPARRPGVSAQKSASQRLCAFSPSQRSSCSPALGGRAVRLLDGKNGGIGVGVQQLGGETVAARLLEPAGGVPVAVRGLAPQVGERVHERLDPLVELVVVRARQVLAVGRDLGAGVAVDREDDVAPVDDGVARRLGDGGARHAVLPFVMALPRVGRSGRSAHHHGRVRRSFQTSLDCWTGSRLTEYASKSQ